MTKLMVVLLMLTASPANGQTSIVFRLLPPGHDGQVQGVGRARYYLLDDYLKLAAFDSELVNLQADVQDLRTIEEELRKGLAAKDSQIQSLESDKKILADRGLRLDGNLKKCEKDLVAASSPPIWPYVVAIVGVVLGVAGFSYGLAK